MSEVKRQLIKRKILQMRDLPTIPSHIQKLMRMLRDPNADIDEVFKAINQDVSLVARILKLVNSSFYSLPIEVTSMEHAVSLVGFNNVWELVMSSSVMDVISSREKTLWDHSYSSSLCVQEIMRMGKVKCSQRLPLTMLMHDIGKLVLMNFNKATYRLVQEACAESGEMQYMAEEKHLGVTHMEVGAWLLESWEMDESQIIPVHQHHMRIPPKEYQAETAIMAIADYCDLLGRRMVHQQPKPWMLEAAGLQGNQLTDIEIFQRNQLFELQKAATAG